MEAVYLLTHVHQLKSDDDEKVIGIYRTEADARAAIVRLSTQPGFAASLDGFVIDKYELNQDHWTGGPHLPACGRCGISRLLLLELPRRGGRHSSRLNPLSRACMDQRFVLGCNHC